MADLRCNAQYLNEQIKETKRVLNKSNYPPYKKELRKMLKFWEKELKYCNKRK